ncbi:MAG: molybdenum cofactor guanylyltransferase MobA [Pseudomonadota bacterium]
MADAPISGLILAGGQGSRMGGRDKGLVAYQGRALVDHVIARIAPQVDELFISANRNLDDYAQRGYRVIPDPLPDFQGPLAGVLAGLRAAGHPWMLIVPCDMPRLPRDLAARLLAARAQRPVVIAEDGVRCHPAVMLMRTDLTEALEAYLASGRRSVHGFQESAGFARARFEAAEMANINSLSDTGLCQPGDFT